MAHSPDPQPEPAEQGLSLDALTEAFAQAMGAQPGADAGFPAESAKPQAAAEEAAEEHDPCEICPRSILEAILFVGNRENQPLSAARAAELMRGVEPEEIPSLVDELNEGYLANGRPYLVSHAGSGYGLVLRERFHPLRNRFYGRVREARLSQAAVDVLAVVAYQQPLTAEEVNRLRGKPSNHVLAQLVLRGLLRVERKESLGRQAGYSTTDRFLRLFGLGSLEDLPHSEDLDRQ